MEVLIRTMADGAIFLSYCRYWRISVENILQQRVIGDSGAAELIPRQRSIAIFWLPGMPAKRRPIR